MTDTAARVAQLMEDLLARREILELTTKHPEVKGTVGAHVAKARMRDLDDIIARLKEVVDG